MDPTPPPPTPNPQEVPPSILQHPHTKGTPTPHTPTPNPQEVPPAILHTDTLRGPPPNPSTPTHREYHPQSYNTHTLKGPPPLPLNHRKYNPPSHNITHLTPSLNVNILLSSEPVYYKLVQNINIIQRNVYRSNQRTMLIYCHPVNLCTMTWYPT